MFAPLPDGVYSFFPANALDEALSTMERRPVAAGYLADGDVVVTSNDTARYSWLI